jgi:secreted Zn-dependent insulinase-like peptidase
VVTAIQAEFENQGGVGFVIQSPVASSQELVRRTQAFLAEQRQSLEEMTEPAFEEAKAGLIAELLERDKNLGSRADRYWSDLDEGILTFDGREQVAGAITELSQPDLLGFFDTVIEKIENRHLLIWSQGKFGEDEAPSSAE